MPLIKKDNSLIVYNSQIRRETISLTKCLNLKLNINDDDSKQQQIEHQEHKVTESDIKKPKITLQKWSITSWLNSQKTKKVLSKKSEETDQESKTSDSGVEVQFECDHDYEASNSSSSDDHHISQCSNLVGHVKIKSIEWSKYPKELVDTHCHFDMLFNRINYKKSIDSYFIDFKDYYINNFKACITVICNPDTYNTKSSLESCLNSIKNEKVFATIGCHPHFANKWDGKIENYVYSSLTHPKIVAIGECGLDVSRKNKVTMEKQEQVFLAQLKIARETDMPIVIHCRDAEKKVFEIMVKNLKETHRIHLHCFTGGWQIGKMFLDKFPNLCIGVTSLITFRTANSVYELVKNIPIDRLLFETDSPYFLPQIEKFQKSKIHYSHPAFVFTVVESVSKIKNISIDVLIQSNRDNVRSIYGF